MSFEHFKHTYEDIAAHTSLKADFISRAHSRLSGFFKDYRAYGQNNQVRFDDSGLMLWNRVAQLKRDNKNLPEIAEALERDLQNTLQNPPQGYKSGSETLQNGLQSREGEGTVYPASENLLVARIEKLYERLLSEKDEKLEEVKTSMRMLLPEGKTPDQLKAELEQKEKLASEVEILRKDINHREEHESEKNKRRQVIYNELLNLGVFDGKKRRRLLEELKSLQ